jgi:hypothetical protein
MLSYFNEKVDMKVWQLIATCGVFIGVGASFMTPDPWIGYVVIGVAIVYGLIRAYVTKK